MNIEAELYDFIVDNNIATEEEVRLVTNINGWNEETMFDIIFARTGLRSYEQCIDEGYTGSSDLDDYYGLNEEDEEEDEDEEDEDFEEDED